MKKKLVRHGNSTALVLDKPLLKLLGIESGGSVEISVRGRTLLVRPVGAKKSSKASFKEKEKQRLYDEIVEVYADDFEKLA